jgi:hypothetical protein
MLSDAEFRIKHAIKSLIDKSDENELKRRRSVSGKKLSGIECRKNRI